MKKTFICLAAAALMLGLNHKAITSSSQPPVGHTGAPGQTTCATSGCHTGNLNTGSGSVVLLNAPSTFVGGATYTMQVQVNLGGRTRAGFQLVALDHMNQQAGSLALVNSTTTALQTAGGKQYLSHKNASATNTWTFNWTAPAAGTGMVHFYFAGNAANGDGNATGDFIYTGTLVLNESTATGIKETQTAILNVFPSPATSSLNLNLAEGTSNVKVLDITGREIHNQHKPAVETQLDVSNYPNGTYFLQVEKDKLLQLKRFMVQH